jgi:hypothetical protein
MALDLPLSAHGPLRLEVIGRPVDGADRASSRPRRSWRAIIQWLDRHDPEHHHAGDRGVRDGADPVGGMLRYNEKRNPKTPASIYPQLARWKWPGPWCRSSSWCSSGPSRCPCCSSSRKFLWPTSRSRRRATQWYWGYEYTDEWLCLRQLHDRKPLGDRAFDNRLDACSVEAQLVEFGLLQGQPVSCWPPTPPSW